MQPGTIANHELGNRLQRSHGVHHGCNGLKGEALANAIMLQRSHGVHHGCNSCVNSNSRALRGVQGRHGAVAGDFHLQEGEADRTTPAGGQEGVFHPVRLGWYGVQEDRGVGSPSM